MLTKLTITNFQKHKYLELNLSPLTCIVGSNSRGKSSVLRAIRWVCFNKPSGERIINREESHCSVELEVDDHLIKKEKGDKNLYYLDEKLYQAFGTDVPVDISRLLNLEEINYQSQKEGTLYWFGLTAGEVTKKLNQIVDLELIDLVLGRVGKLIRENNTEIKLIEQRIYETRKERDSLEWVLEADKAYREIEQLEEEISEEVLGIERLSNLVKESEKYRQQVIVDLPLDEIQKINRLIQEVKDLEQEVRRLSNLMEQADGLEEKAKFHHQEWLNVTQEMRVKITKNCPLCQRPL